MKVHEESKSNMRTARWISAFAVFTASLAIAADAPEEFFIISSVDLGKQQLLLKLPTEVTELMGIDKNTRFLDEQGKTIRLADLRTGDTVFITSTPGGGHPVAIVVRKGAMTLEVLRQRYLKTPK